MGSTMTSERSSLLSTTNAEEGACAIALLAMLAAIAQPKNAAIRVGNRLAVFISAHYSGAPVELSSCRVVELQVGLIIAHRGAHRGPHRGARRGLVGASSGASSRLVAASGPLGRHGRFGPLEPVGRA